MVLSGLSTLASDKGRLPMTGTVYSNYKKIGQSTSFGVAMLSSELEHVADLVGMLNDCTTREEVCRRLKADLKEAWARLTNH